MARLLRGLWWSSSSRGWEGNISWPSGHDASRAICHAHRRIPTPRLWFICTTNTNTHQLSSDIQKLQIYFLPSGRPAEFLGKNILMFFLDCATPSSSSIFHSPCRNVHIEHTSTMMNYFCLKKRLDRKNHSCCSIREFLFTYRESPR